LIRSFPRAAKDVAVKSLQFQPDQDPDRQRRVFILEAQILSEFRNPHGLLMWCLREHFSHMVSVKIVIARIKASIVRVRVGIVRVKVGTFSVRVSTVRVKVRTFKVRVKVNIVKVSVFILTLYIGIIVLFFW
jgi:hypothetical protein